MLAEQNTLLEAKYRKNPFSEGLKNKNSLQKEVNGGKKMVEGYSVKAKKKVKIKDPVIVQTARGGYMAKGKCPETGITVCAMLSKENAEKAIESGEAKKNF